MNTMPRRAPIARRTGEHPGEHAVRIFLEQQTIDVGARIALVAVGDDVTIGSRCLARDPPLLGRQESGSAAAAKACALDGSEDLVARGQARVLPRGVWARTLEQVAQHHGRAHEAAPWHARRRRLGRRRRLVAAPEAVCRRAAHGLGAREVASAAAACAATRRAVQVVIEALHAFELPRGQPRAPRDLLDRQRSRRLEQLPQGRRRRSPL
jgi:hypothetical protein